MQVLPPAAAPQGPATHKRQEPPRAEERRPPTGERATTSSVRKVPKTD